MITRCVDVFNPSNPPIRLLIIDTESVTLVQVLPTPNFLFYGSLNDSVELGNLQVHESTTFWSTFFLGYWRGKDTTSITNGGGFLRNYLLVRILIALVKLLGRFAFDI